MRNIFQLITLAALAILSSCAGEIDSRINQNYYTKFSLHHEKGHYFTTNYNRGMLLPVNSEVVIEKVNKKVIGVEILSSGERFTIINVPKHTDENIDQAFNKIFSKAPLNLSNFSALEKRNITEGKVENGMRKEAVIAAIGYPPKIKTPTLESNEWIYWTSRFDKISITFQDGKVAGMKD